MALIINEKYRKENKAFFLFITNRLLRLYPLYFSITLLTLIVFSVDYSVFHYTGNWIGNFILHANQLSKDTIAYILVSNFLIVGQDLALFLGLDLTDGSLFFTGNFKESSPQLNTFMILGQAWTIGLEIIFYLIVPFVARKRVLIIAVLVSCSLLTRLFIYYVLHMKYDPWTYRFFPTELFYFLLGVLGYKVYAYLSQCKINERYSYVLWGMLCLFTATYGNIFSLLTGNHLYQTIFHLFYTAFFVSSLPLIFILTKNNTFDKQIGELSYPIYLGHGLLLYFNERLQIDSVNFVVVSTITLAIILNHVVTRPIELIRQRRVFLWRKNDDEMVMNGSILVPQVLISTSPSS